MLTENPELRAALLKKRIVPITGEIDEAAMVRVIDALTILQVDHGGASEPITLAFFSGGGISKAGFASQILPRMVSARHSTRPRGG